MVERLLGSVLNRMLGHLLHVDEDQLRLSLWSGKLSLHAVRIRETVMMTAVPESGLKVSNGQVDTLEITVNWRRLTTEPIRIVVEGVRATLQQDQTQQIDVKNMNDAQCHYDIEEEFAKALERKAEKLKQAEQWKIAMQTDENVGHERGYIAKLVSKIIDNVQISVKDVKVEVVRGDGGEKSVLGVAIQKVEACTVNENGTPAFVSNEKYAYKQVQMEDMVIYCYKQEKAWEENKKTFSATISEVLAQHPDAAILERFGLSIGITLNKKTMPSPKLKLNGTIGAVHLNFSHAHMQAILGHFEDFTKLGKKMQQNRKHVELNERSPTPLERAEYLNLYKRTLNATWLPALTDVELTRLSTLECEIFTADLLKLRSACFHELSKELKGSAVVRRADLSKNQGLFSRIWSAWSGNSDMQMNGGTESQSAELDEADKAAFEQSLSDLDVTALEILDSLPVDYVLIDLQLSFDGLELRLLEGLNTPLVSFLIGSLQLQVFKRPTSMLISFRMQSVALADLSVVDSPYPQLISCLDHSENHDFLQLTFELNPPALPRYDSSLTMSIAKPQFVVYVPTLMRLQNFFALQPSASADIIQLWGLEKLQQLRMLSSSVFMDTLTSSHRIHLNAQVAAPVILLATPMPDSSPACFIADLGQLQVNSLEFTDSLPKVSTFEQFLTLPLSDRRAFYLSFNMCLSQTSLYFSDYGVKWEQCFSQRVITPLTFNIEFGKLSSGRVPHAPPFYVSASMDSASLLVSPDRIRRFQQLLITLSSFGSSNPSDAALPIPLSSGTTSPRIAPMQQQRNQQLSFDDVKRLLGSILEAEAFFHAIGKEKTELISYADVDEWQANIQTERAEWPKILLSTHFQELSVQFQHDFENVTGSTNNVNADDTSLTVLSASMADVSFRFVQFEYDMNVQASLSTILIRNVLASAPNDAVLSTVVAATNTQLSNSTKNARFILLDFVMHNSLSPLFSQHDAAFELDLSLADLHIVIERHSALAAGNFLIYELLSSFQPNKQLRKPMAVQERLRSDTLVSELQRQLSENLQLNDDNASRFRTKKQLHAHFVFRSLNVNIFEKAMPLCDASMTTLELTVDKHLASLSLALRLHSIDVEDMIADHNIHRCIIHSLVGDCVNASKNSSPGEQISDCSSLIDIIFCIYDPLMPDYPGYESSVQGSLHQLHVCYSHSFVMSMLNYVNNGVGRELLNILSGYQPATVNESGALISSPLHANVATLKLSHSDELLATNDVKPTKRFPHTNLRLSHLKFILPGSILLPHHMNASIDNLEFSIENKLASDSIAVTLSNASIHIQTAGITSPLRVFHLPQIEVNADLTPGTMLKPLTVSTSVRLPSIEIMITPISYRYLVQSSLLSFQDEAMFSLSEDFDTPSLADPYSPTMQRTTEQQLSSFIDLRCSVLLSAVTCRLAHDVDTEISEDQRNGLLSASVKQIDFKLEFSSIDDLHCVISASALDMVDEVSWRDLLAQREVLPCYRKILFFEHGSNENLPLRLEFNRRNRFQNGGSSIGRTIINASLTGMRFRVGPVLLIVGNFFSLQQTDDAIMTKNSLETAASTVHRAIDTSDTGFVKTNTEINLAMIEPSIEFIVDPYSEHTYACVLSWAFSMRLFMGNDVSNPLIELNANISNANCVIVDIVDGCRLIQQDTRPLSTILEPTALLLSSKLNLSKRFAPGGHRLPYAVSVSVDCQDITLRFTYTSYRMALAAIDVVTAIMAAPLTPGFSTTSSQSYNSSKRLTSMGKDGAVSQQSSNDISLSANADVELFGPVAPSSALGRVRIPDDNTDEKVLTLYGLELVDAKIPCISIHFINDISKAEYPIARFLLDNLALQGVSGVHSRSLTLHCFIAADYFNMNRACWEPFIEPESLTARLLMSLVLSETPNTSMVDSRKNIASEGHSIQHETEAFQGQTPTWSSAGTAYSADLAFDNGTLNVNFTFSMLQSINAVITLLSKADKIAEKQLSDASIEQLMSLRFKNSTDIASVRFTSFTSIKSGIITVHGVEQECLVPPYCEQAFDLLSPDALLLSVSIDSPTTGKPILTQLNLGQLRPHLWIIPANIESGSVSATTTHLFLDVSINDGIKVITLHGQMGIINHTERKVFVHAAERTMVVSCNEGRLWLPVISAPNAISMSLDGRIASHPVSISSGSFDANRMSATVSIPIAADPSAEAAAIKQSGLWHVDFTPQLTTTLPSTGKTVNKGATSFGFTEFHISTPFSIANTLPIQLDCRLFVQHDQHLELQQEFSLFDTAPFHVHCLPSSLLQYTWVSIRVPFLGTTWSTAELLKRKKQRILLQDRLLRELWLNFDYIVTPFCGVRSVVFVDYFLYDLTNIGMVVSFDRRHTIPLGDQQTFAAQMTSLEKYPELLSFPPDVAKKLYVTSMNNIEKAASVDDVHFSECCNIELGMTSSILIPDRNVRNNLTGLLDIGVTVSAGSPPFHRSLVVTMAPHFVIVNELPIDVIIHQSALKFSSITGVMVASGHRQPFHWPDASAPRILSIRRIDTDGWKWSGDFDPSQIGDFHVSVRHCQNPQHFWFPRISLQLKDTTVFVILNQPQQSFEVLTASLRYRINNRCVSTYVRFRQVSLNKQRTKSDWIVVRPYESLPWEWEDPLHKGLLEVAVNEQQPGVFEQIIRVQPDENIDLAPLKITTSDGVSAKAYIYISSDGPTREINISGYPNPEIAFVSSESGEQRALAIASVRQRRISELKELIEHLDLAAKQMETRLKSLRDSINAIEQKGPLLRPEFVPQNGSFLLLNCSTHLDQTSISAKRTIAIFLSLRFKGQTINSPPFDSVRPLHLRELFEVPDGDDDLTCHLEFHGINSALLSYTSLSLNELLDYQQHTMTLICPQPSMSQADDSGTNQGLQLQIQMQLIPAPLDELRSHVAKLQANWQDKLRVLHSVRLEFESFCKLSRPRKTIRGRTEYRFMVNVLDVLRSQSLLHDIEHSNSILICFVQSSLTGQTSTLELKSQLQPVVHFDMPQTAIDSRGDLLTFVIQRISLHDLLQERVAHSAVALQNVKDSCAAEWQNKLISLTMSDNLPKSQALSMRIAISRMQARLDELRPNMSVKFTASIGLSVIDNKPEELLYISLNGVAVELQDTFAQRSLEVHADNFQIDNQQLDATFPIVLSPTPVEIQEKQPILQLAVVRAKDYRLIFDVMNLLIQSLDVKIEEALIWKLLGLVHEFSPGGAAALFGEQKVVATVDGHSLAISSDIEPTPDSTLQMVYVQALSIQPLSINVSFEAESGMRKSSLFATPLGIALSAASTTLGSVRDAPIRIYGKLMQGVYGTWTTIAGNLMQFYMTMLIKQWYKVMFSIEAIGNPIALVSNVGSGIVDMIYEPAKGVFISPTDFGKGLAKGSRSLVRSLTGVLGAVGSISNTLSKAANFASMDQAHMTSQHRQMINQQSKSLGSGVSYGIQTLGKGLFNGVTGIVTDPFKGAQKDGMAGLATGFMKGGLGLVAKPVGGFAAAIGSTLQGASNSATSMIDGAKVLPKKIRPRRYIPESGVLRVYSLDEALAHSKDKHAKSPGHK